VPKEFAPGLSTKTRPTNPPARQDSAKPAARGSFTGIFRGRKYNAFF